MVQSVLSGVTAKANFFKRSRHTDEMQMKCEDQFFEIYSRAEVRGSENDKRED